MSQVITADYGVKLNTQGATLIENLPIEDYHAFADIKKLGDKAILSKSMLAVFDPCPVKFHDQFILGNREESTAGMEIGSATHLHALQRDLFDAHHYIMPLKDDGKQIVRNAAHAAYKEQIKLAAGRILLQPSDLEKVEGMSSALKKNKKAMLLLDAPGKVEVSIFFRDPQTGLMFRCRPDKLRDDLIVVDLKATGRADNEGVKKISFDKRYDLSVAITGRGIKELTGEYPRDYWFLFAEMERPYVIEARSSFTKVNYQGGKISKSYWQIGEERLSRLLDRYMECRAKGIYPGYNSEFMPMEAPDFQVRKLYEDGE